MQGGLKERGRGSDIFSRRTDRGHVSNQGKMTVEKREPPDMCVSLSGANRLVHPHPDEWRKTSKAAGGSGRKGKTRGKRGRTNTKWQEKRVRISSGTKQSVSFYTKNRNSFFPLINNSDDGEANVENRAWLHVQTVTCGKREMICGAALAISMQTY